MNFRIGQGYDIHRTILGRPLVIGGVVLEAPFGLEGHSDADVLIHAVIDAILGAFSLGDIGQWFPDTEEQWRDADSAHLLSLVLHSPKLPSFQLGNLDCTLFAERPKFAPHIPAIRRSLASLMGCSVEQISVKAKTLERLGAIGEGNAIAASATLLLQCC